MEPFYVDATGCRWEFSGYGDDSYARNQKTGQAVYIGPMKYPGGSQHAEVQRALCAYSDWVERKMKKLEVAEEPKENPEPFYVDKEGTRWDFVPFRGHLAAVDHAGSRSAFIGPPYHVGSVRAEVQERLAVYLEWYERKKLAGEPKKGAPEATFVDSKGTRWYFKRHGLTWLADSYADEGKKFRHVFLDDHPLPGSVHEEAQVALMAFVRELKGGIGKETAEKPEKVWLGPNGWVTVTQGEARIAFRASEVTSLQWLPGNENPLGALSGFIASSPVPPRVCLRGKNGISFDFTLSLEEFNQLVDLVTGGQS